MEGRESLAREEGAVKGWGRKGGRERRAKDRVKGATKCRAKGRMKGGVKGIARGRGKAKAKEA